MRLDLLLTGGALALPAIEAAAAGRARLLQHREQHVPGGPAGDDAGGRARDRLLCAAQPQIQRVPAVPRGGHPLEHLRPGLAIRHGAHELVEAGRPLPGEGRRRAGHAGVVLHREPEAQERLLPGAARGQHLREQEVAAPVAARALQRPLQPRDRALAPALERDHRAEQRKVGLRRVAEHGRAEL
ncbi:hypothetical protein BE17_40025, partial [Sorangium cellulosum]